MTYTATCRGSAAISLGSTSYKVMALMACIKYRCTNIPSTLAYCTAVSAMRGYCRDVGRAHKSGMSLLQTGIGARLHRVDLQRPRQSLTHGQGTAALKRRVVTVTCRGPERYAAVRQVQRLRCLGGRHPTAGR